MIGAWRGEGRSFVFARQVVKPKKMTRKFGLMRLNPNVEKKRLWDVGANVARWTKLSSAGSTRIFDKKIGLSRLNSIF